MSKPVIPVFFTIDESYAPWLAIALESMKKNASKDCKVKAHVVYKDMNEETIKRLEKIGDEDFEVLFSPMPHDLDMISDRIGNRLRADFFTLTIFFRLFLPDMFPEYDKAIYLDSDIVVPGDISKMYNIALDDNFLGVVNDYSIKAVPELNHYVADAVGVDKDHYFNSGILLMNFKKIREHGLSKRFLDLLQKYHFDTIAPDQDYLNSLCKDKVTYLDPTWDSMPCDQPEFENPQIIHYNLFDKPWCYDNIKYEDYFWNYAKDSDFYDEIVEYKNSYSKAQKESDRNALALLTKRGNEIPDQEVTMKKVFESGLEERL